MHTKQSPPCKYPADFHVNIRKGSLSSGPPQICGNQERLNIIRVTRQAMLRQVRRRQPQVATLLFILSKVASYKHIYKSQSCRYKFNSNVVLWDFTFSKCNFNPSLDLLKRRLPLSYWENTAIRIEKLKLWCINE